MNENTCEAELNSLLTQCEQIHKRLEGVLAGRYKWIDIPNDTLPTHIIDLANLVSSLDQVEELLKQITLDGALQNVAKQPLNFYREVVAPNKERYTDMFNKIMTILGDGDYTTIPRPTSDWAVSNILHTGLDFWEITDDDTYSDEDLKAAKRLIYSAFFRPDEWLKNADELEPVLGKNAERRIPVNVRFRITELYYSFILGNYLSTLALARTILEYSLIDRAPQIGINAYVDGPQYPNQPRNLYLLVEDTSEKIPDLKMAMEKVRVNGINALHPRKKSNLILVPAYLRQLAKESIESVRLIVEKLYLDL